MGYCDSYPDARIVGKICFLFLAAVAVPGACRYLLVPALPPALAFQKLLDLFFNLDMPQGDVRGVAVS